MLLRLYTCFNQAFINTHIVVRNIVIWADQYVLACLGSLSSNRRQPAWVTANGIKAEPSPFL